MHINTKLRVLEFVVAGVALDLIENSIIIRATTGRSLLMQEIGIALLIIVPFAILTELVIDHPRFWHRLFRLKGHKFDHLDFGRGVAPSASSPDDSSNPTHQNGTN